MNDKYVVIGLFENELNAAIAKRDLRLAGVKASILKEAGGVTLHLLRHAEGIKILVPEFQEKIAKEILQIKYF